MTAGKIVFACIGGKYAYELASSGKLPAERIGLKMTPFGKSQPIYRCRCGGGEFYLLFRHSDNPTPIASSFVNHRANIYALKELGTTHILSWSAARAVSHNYRVGQFAVVDDLIDETRQRIGTFFEHGAIGDLRQWPVFCMSLRSTVSRALDELDIKFVQRGTYLCSEGPRRETRAEVQKYAMWGADLLGHGLAPETFLAKELQMCYANLCFVAEFAETGSGHRPFEAGCLFDGLAVEDDHRRAKDALDQIPRILERVFTCLSECECNCCCQKNLSEMIADGQLDEDFRSWFKTFRPTTSPAMTKSLRGRRIAVAE
jgi:5'-methylthioadenosine phosphorylase